MSKWSDMFEKEKGKSALERHQSGVQWDYSDEYVGWLEKKLDIADEEIKKLEEDIDALYEI